MLYQPPMDLLVQIAVIRDRIAATFLQYQNVVACGIGLKIKDGQLTTTPSLVVSVTQKVPETNLPASHIIPPMIGNIPTDVVETGLITALDANRLSSIRPVHPGVSIGHQDGTAGTLACVVKRGDQMFLLGNNHVMALLNGARIGDPILQPGPADGGTLDNAIGELAGFEIIRFFNGEGLAEKVVIVDSNTGAATQEPHGCAALLARLFGWGSTGTSSTGTTPSSSPPTIPENRVDAAITKPYNNIPIDPSIIDLSHTPVGVADPRLGMHVFKSGRASGVTEGFITQVDVMVDVQYGTRKARYVNQIITTPMSQHGDSGSLLVNGNREALGLIFSGSNLVSIACPIRFVLAALRVDLVTLN